MLLRADIIAHYGIWINSSFQGRGSSCNHVFSHPVICHSAVAVASFHLLLEITGTYDYVQHHCKDQEINSLHL